jgi:hypothetical protein
MCRWGLKHTGVTSPNFSWLGPHRVPINTVIGAPIKVLIGPQRGAEQLLAYTSLYNGMLTSDNRVSEPLLCAGAKVQGRCVW